jgi:hypothetical protein
MAHTPPLLALVASLPPTTVRVVLPKKRLAAPGLLALLLALLLACAASAQCPGLTTQVTAFATENLTVSTTPIALTTTIYKPSGITPAMAVISVKGDTINYDVVGTPTADLGHPAAGTFVICGVDTIAAFRAIRITTDASLKITYYKVK